MKIEDIPYDIYVKEGFSILDDYNEACLWLEEVGLNFKRSRFGEYKRRLENIAMYVDEESSEKEIVEALHQYLSSHYEAFELIRIKKAMEGVEFDDYKQRLKKVTSGSAFKSSAERDQSRSFSFELSMAARFIKAGFDVDLTHIADIVAIVDGVKIYVECKRVRSEKKIEANIKKANQQLQSRLSREKSKRSRGLVAININDILNPNNRMVVLNSHTELKKMNSLQLNEFTADNEQSLRAKEHRKVLGVICEYTSQALLQEQEPVAICNCRGANFYQYSYSKSSAKSLTRRLAETLANQEV